MKRVLFFITSFTLTFGLAGCNFLTGKDEEFTESYCRENPDSTICQGETFDNLTSEGTKSLFKNILNDYKEDVNGFCETYFSITNLELLDLCREDISNFFPDDLEEYDISTVEYEYNVGYHILVYKNQLSKSYSFTINIVSVKGTTYVEEWIFEEIDPEETDPLEIEVPLEEIEIETALFIEKYINESISSVEVCNEYYPHITVQNCISERDQYLPLGLELQFIRVEYEYEIHSVHVKMKYPDYPDFVEASFVMHYYYLDDMSIKSVIGSILPFLYSEMYLDYQTLLEHTIDTLLESDSPNDICETKFSIPSFDDCVNFKLRMNLLGATYSIEKFEINSGGWGYDIIIKIKFPEYFEEFTNTLLVLNYGEGLIFGYSLPQF